MDTIDQNEELAFVLKRIAKAHIKWNVHKHHLMASIFLFKETLTS
ncbi:unnamed protein product [Toxocara canis]|uniref:GLOBIN domain-containing protein n=1 Tax=Toxocara canis TaxID=6265 RepID=A0A183UDE8_TOXCA|nr:unnamed protein product [Toxocara canis]